ncbi:M20 aminoacylase family protein [Agrobacterium fabrum]|uniref:M20 aminoacylase family protein n=1 Tax=Agrobacterium fabrum TaxID=1176649 RepID=UPI00298F1AFE|nr:M20 aminoacylase family protein [Agrobacterium fabrum]
MPIVFAAWHRKGYIVNSLFEQVKQLQPELTAFRRDIHAHPELGFEESRTPALVAEKLRGLGIEVTEGVGKTGVVGTLKGRLPGQRAIGLRADMDALTLSEQTDKPYASQNPGVMHACGHDGHTAMLLGAARYLSEHPDFAGTVHFIFQPAEEGRGGAKAMLADGLFERFPVDAVYGMHNLPGVPLGTFHTRVGPALAAGDRWTVTFRGTGGHGGLNPHGSTDVLVLQAQFILAIQTIVSRNVSPIEAAVVSVGTVQGGQKTALNVMPSEVVVGGVARSYLPEVRDTIERRLREIAEGLAATFGCTADIWHWRHGTALVNHAEQTAIAVAAASEFVGKDLVDENFPPRTGGEDFASMLLAKPGNFIYLGQGDTAGLHEPTYDFNDEAIPYGVGYWVTLAMRELNS